MQSIFDYLDYRKYLLDFYTDKKKQMPYYSYRLIGQSVNMDSAFLIRVLQGALHISTKKIEAFVKLCKLTGQEALYFEALVNFNKSKTDSERKVYFDILFKISRVKTQNLKSFQYEFFLQWYYSAVWSLIQMHPQKANYNIIANLCQPQITFRQAKSSVNLLLRLGLIKFNTQDMLEVTSAHFSTGEKWSSSVIAQYQSQMIQRADDSLKNIDKSERDISTLTLTIPESAFAQVQEMTAEFRRSLVSLADELPNPNRAYQLNIQLFPITKKVADESK